MAEASLGPVVTLVGELQAEPKQLAKFRSALEKLAASARSDNALRQHFVMTRATKVS